MRVLWLCVLGVVSVLACIVVAWCCLCLLRSEYSLCVVVVGCCGCRCGIVAACRPRCALLLCDVCVGLLLLCGCCGCVFLVS